MGYIDDVMKAIDEMEHRLTEPITLEEAAAWAGYSPYHFHRLFQTLTGLTVGSYLRGRRLTEAAAALAGTGKRILDIALEYQFQSQEGFTRAFARAFGMTPFEYRKSKLRSVPHPRLRITREQLVHLKEGVSMKPRIVSKDPLKLVGMAYHGYHGDVQFRDVAALWQRFISRSSTIANAKGEGAYGVCFDDKGEDQPFSYIACIEVDSLEDIPIEMVGKTLPANDYAVFTLRGIGNIGKTYQYAYGTWLPNSDYVLAGDYDFEYYGPQFKDDAESEMEIWIPVKAKVK